MKKIKDAALKQLNENYERACNAWVKELERMWDMQMQNGYWIDEPGGVYDFDGAWTLGMTDITYAVRHGVTMEQAADWQEYVCWAAEFDFQLPTLREYVENSVPMPDHDAQQRITDMKAELTRLCNEERARLKTQETDQANLEFRVKN